MKSAMIATLLLHSYKQNRAAYCAIRLHIPHAHRQSGRPKVTVRRRVWPALQKKTENKLSLPFVGCCAACICKIIFATKYTAEHFCPRHCDRNFAGVSPPTHSRHPSLYHVQSASVWHVRPAAVAQRSASGRLLQLPQQSGGDWRPAGADPAISVSVLYDGYLTHCANRNVQNM